MQIEKANFLKNFVIELELSNKQKIYYDLKPQLSTARFKHIKNQAFFETGKISGSTIHLLVSAHRNSRLLNARINNNKRRVLKIRGRFHE